MDYLISLFLLDIGPSFRLLRFSIYWMIGLLVDLVGIVSFIFYRSRLDYTLQRWFHLHLLESFPVKIDRSEKFMISHLIVTFVAQPLFRLKLQNRVYKIFKLLAYPRIFPGSVVLCLLDNSFNFKLIFDVIGSKRRVVVWHLISIDSDGPDINLSTISLLEHHLRCIVYSRTCLCSAQFILIDFLGKPKISELGITILKNQYIFWFEITIHNIMFVKVFHPHYQASQDKSNCFFTCFFEIIQPCWSFIDESIRISSLSPLHHKV